MRTKHVTPVVESRVQDAPFNIYLSGSESIVDLSSEDEKDIGVAAKELGCSVDLLTNLVAAHKETCKLIHLDLADIWTRLDRINERVESLETAYMLD